MKRVLVGCVLCSMFLFMSSGAQANRRSDSSPAADEKTAGVENAADAAGSTTAVAPQPTENAATSSSSSAPQSAAKDKKAASPTDEYRPAPKFTPMLATTGTLGFFTQETAETLPKGGFAFSAFGNKFSRMPGSVTIFQIGIDAGYGITDRWNVYASFVPYGHAHVGNGSQLSLAPVNQLHPIIPGTIYPSLAPLGGGNPGYIEDFPLTAINSGGDGNITLGLKYAMLSQKLGDPFGFSIRNDVIISSRSSYQQLLNNGMQASPLSDLISLAISKQWGNAITATLNGGYMFTGDYNSGPAPVHIADQVRVGAGLLFFPESRIQPMVESSAVVFTSSGSNFTPDFTFAARDPVDGIWGLRLYPWRHLAIDAGYRYMLNLKGAHDRNGFVVKLGTGYWPEKAPPAVNHAPTATCSAEKSMVFVGSGDAVNITATASVSDNDPLTYNWTASGGRVEGTGAQARWSSEGVGEGTYTITVKVDDGRGESASCSSTVAVQQKPNHPPSITCSGDRSSVFAGERVHITCNASDPDGDALNYVWRANAGQINGNGPAADFDTTGLSPGNYSITTRVDDGKGGAADTQTSVEVKAAPPPPQASKINECMFNKPLSARIDNVCKRILDDVALRLQNEPRASAVIIGYSDPKEGKPGKVAQDRGSNAVKYLGEKGIDASRVNTRSGNGQAGANNNRRIDIVFVPEGATY
jgi:hypothetical protein